MHLLSCSLHATTVVRYTLIYWGLNFHAANHVVCWLDPHLCYLFVHIINEFRAYLMWSCRESVMHYLGVLCWLSAELNLIAQESTVSSPGFLLLFGLYISEMKTELFIDTKHPSLIIYNLRLQTREGVLF